MSEHTGYANDEWFNGTPKAFGSQAKHFFSVGAESQLGGVSTVAKSMDV